MRDIGVGCGKPMLSLISAWGAFVRLILLTQRRQPLQLRRDIDLRQSGVCGSISNQAAGAGIVGKPLSNLPSNIRGSLSYWYDAAARVVVLLTPLHRFRHKHEGDTWEQER
jgi:hypothetical protein